MKLIAHAHNPKSGLVVLIEKSYGMVFDYNRKKKVMSMGYWIIWGGVPRVRDGNVFRKTRKGGFSYFKRMTGKL